MAKNKTILELQIPYLYELIVRKQRAVLAFHKGGQDIKFKEVKALGRVFVEIEKGVFVRLIKIVNKKHFVLECNMANKAELALHRHSDFKEVFSCLKGALFDKISHTLTTDNITFDKNEWHNLVAIGDTKLIIDCIKY